MQQQISEIFQFTTSQGGRLFSHYICTFFFDAFQFTTSQGGRLNSMDTVNAALAFQFTTSQGGRPLVEWFYSGNWIFQFTTSQGGRQDTGSLHCYAGAFNSRPHKEVDFDRYCTLLTGVTFQFTTSQGGRRRTSRRDVRSERLSIHDLTRRSTREC